MSDPEAPVRKARHLIDLDAPRPQRPTQQQGMSITQVQKWVMSVLAFVTIEHLAAGIAIAAIFTHAQYVGPRIGLNVIAGITGVLAVAAFRLIHGWSALSLWLVVGVVPGVVGAWLSFR